MITVLSNQSIAVASAALRKYLKLGYQSELTRNEDGTADVRVQFNSQTLTDYSAASFALADALGIFPAQARADLLRATNLSPAKLDWLRCIARVKDRQGLLPEHIYESSCAKNPRQWLIKAAKEGWSPIELRRRIRESKRTIHKDKAVKLPNWARNLMLVHGELGRTTFNKQAVSKMLADIQKVVDSKS